MTMTRPSPLSPGSNYDDPPLTLPHDDSLLSTLSPPVRSSTSNTNNASEMRATIGNAQGAGSSGSTYMHGVTPMSDTTMTPRVGNTRRSTSSYDQRNSASLNIRDSVDVEQHYLSTPSWDIDKTFSFRKKSTKGKSTRHQSQRSQSSIAMWDILSSIGPSRSDSMMSVNEESKIQDDDSDENNERLTEETENDLYAMQVGLML